MKKCSRKIEDGEFFGILLRKERLDDNRNDSIIYFVKPKMEIPLGYDEILYSFYFDYSQYSDIRDAIEKFNLGEIGLPLIFQKIDDRLGREILTGYVFNVGDRDNLISEFEDLDEKYDTLPSFCDYNELYKNNPIFIDINAKMGVETDYEKSCYELDSAFKSYYGKVILEHKDEYIKLIRDIVEIAKKNYNEEFFSFGNSEVIQEIAYTENLIYDYKVKVKSK